MNPSSITAPDSSPAITISSSPSYSCVGIVSDTHGTLPDEVAIIFGGSYSPDQIIESRVIDPKAADWRPIPVSLIIHAGDIGHQNVIDELEITAPVAAVLGNCDEPIYRTIARHVGDHAVCTQSDVRFGIVHRPGDLRRAIFGKGELSPAYITPAPDVAVHGHTHVVKIETDASGMLTLCPGSPTRPREFNPPSVMVIYLDGGSVARIDAVSLSACAR